MRNAALVQVVGDGQHVLDRAAEPVELPDDEGVTGAQVAERGAQAGPVSGGLPGAGLLLVDPAASGGAEVVALQTGRPGRPLRHAPHGPGRAEPRRSPQRSPDGTWFTSGRRGAGSPCVVHRHSAAASSCEWYLGNFPFQSGRRQRDRGNHGGLAGFGDAYARPRSSLTHCAGRR